VDAAEDARKLAAPIKLNSTRAGITVPVFIGAGSHHIYRNVKVFVG
jgi:hypothetical protein